MTTYPSSRGVFRVIAIVLGAIFITFAVSKLFARPGDWLNVVTSAVVIVIGSQFVYAGITDRWEFRVSGMLAGPRRPMFMTIDPTEGESIDDNARVEVAANRGTSSSGTSPNPYEPPRTQADSKPRLNAEMFLSGQPFIHYGVVFFVEGGDSMAIHAALPLAEDSEELIQRNVQEAMRVLPEFLDLAPTLRPRLVGRQLVIRMIASYEDLDEEVATRVVRPAAVG